MILEPLSVAGLLIRDNEHLTKNEIRVIDQLYEIEYYISLNGVFHHCSRVFAKCLGLTPL